MTRGTVGSPGEEGEGVSGACGQQEANPPSGRWGCRDKEKRVQARPDAGRGQGDEAWTVQPHPSQPTHPSRDPVPRCHLFCKTPLLKLPPVLGKKGS